MEQLDTAGDYTAVTIAANIHHIKSTLPDGVELVAVSKFHHAEAIMAAYQAGQRIFGESRAQELTAKAPVLPDDIRWHFIGHLQRNKVKYIVPYISLIHSVDSPRLLTEINKQAVAIGRRVDCLLQLHVAQEETKFGFTPQECLDYLASGEWKQMTGIRIRGMMCMASNVNDEEQIASEFRLALQTFNQARQAFFQDDADFSIRSWGMSHDYPIALRCGSNMVRVGTAIFGAREY